jgi:hypothetical protein
MVSMAAMEGYGATVVVGTEAIIATVPEPTRRRARVRRPRYASPPWFTGWLNHTDWQAGPRPPCQCRG